MRVRLSAITPKPTQRFIQQRLFVAGSLQPTPARFDLKRHGLILSTLCSNRRPRIAIAERSRR